MSISQSEWAGVMELGGIALPFLAAGAPQRLSENEALIPSGDVTILHQASNAEFYRHGWNSWGPTGWRHLTEPPLRIYDSEQRLLTADDARNDTPMAHSGSCVGALQLAPGKVLLLGALGLGAPRVGASASTLWGTVEVPGSSWFVTVGDELAVFRRYAEMVGRQLGRRTSQAGRVWCSWYSFYEDIDENLLSQTILDLADLPFEVVQIDDGWERGVGDWLPNSKFPSGMAAMADKIIASGRRAGLWLAPLIALPNSELFKAHRDWMIKDGVGRPLVVGYNWGGPYFGLDTTQEPVQDWLREVFTRGCDWGYSYFKLDFMYAAALAGVRSVDIHREQAYRDAIRLIRDTVGDAYLLGSGAVMMPSAGIFDGVRVGPDVAAFWDNAERPRDPSGVGAKNALINSLNRVWLRHLYETDPDVVYFRRRRSLLDEKQRQAVEDVATVLGFKSSSDPMSWLDDNERGDLAAWLGAEEQVRQVGRFKYIVGSREVDFTDLVFGSGHSASTSVN